MTLRDDKMKQRIEDMKSKKKFNYALSHYRKTIANPYTLS
jgi:hypothetical protein